MKKTEQKISPERIAELKTELHRVKRTLEFIKGMDRIMDRHRTIMFRWKLLHAFMVLGWFAVLFSIDLFYNRFHMALGSFIMGVCFAFVIWK